MSQFANPMCLDARTYLVTGASSGIGRATSILLANLGAKVILVSRSEEALLETQAQMLAGERHHVSSFDLSSGLADTKAWLAQVVKMAGKLNGVVHCAGMHSFCPIKAISDASMDKVLRLNVCSAVNLVTAFRQKNISAEVSKSIVFLASVSGVVGAPAASLYGASKAAIISLAQSLALELASESIRVNSVSPAYVKTRMMEGIFAKLSEAQLKNIEAQHPMGFGEPVDVAHAIAFLLADTAKWVTGSNLVIDGGYTAQ